TFGVDRNLWALADLGLRTEGERVVWHLPAYLAPVPVAVFPLLRKEHGEYAHRLVEELRREGIPAAYDDAGSIGRRYARMDEAGAPFCVTVDGETVDPSHAHHLTVTVRERDSKLQERRAVSGLAGHFRAALRLPRPSGTPAT
ncbi:MAG: His/Gly/Thr/Pro-type tRNA ligase C-terminal domain-containing protein, partial [Thermoplasmata archaeon]|nr:His/Gly/Thr/Pro-type tRNA ligase C-terminal domain-containing protein [Thermoplasmata archaeon]